MYLAIRAFECVAFAKNYSYAVQQVPCYQALHSSACMCLDAAGVLMGPSDPAQEFGCLHAALLIETLLMIVFNCTGRRQDPDVRPACAAGAHGLQLRAAARPQELPRGRQAPRRSGRAPLPRQAIRAQQGPQVREGPWPQEIPRIQGLDWRHAKSGRLCASGKLPCSCVGDAPCSGWYKCCVVQLCIKNGGLLVAGTVLCFDKS